MLIRKLEANHVRNIDSVKITPNPEFNFITGANASGKTAFLEAIYCLARAKSFRSPRSGELIQKTKESFSVIANLEYRTKPGVVTGIERSRTRTELRYDGKPQKTVSEQANNMPLVLLHPDSHTLISGSPKIRRHWLDWALFHVEHNYLRVWKNYHKALRNRNALLKKRGSQQELLAWEENMLVAAEALHKPRAAFIRKLEAVLQKSDTDPFIRECSIELDPGYSEKSGLLESLEKDREKDLLNGHTRAGPHKADVKIKNHEELISRLYSRGQIKRLVSELLLAQAVVYEVITKEKPVLLIDDMGAELDRQAEEKLLNSLANFQAQVFITMTDKNNCFLNKKQSEMFHVEHGKFRKVVE